MPGTPDPVLGSRALTLAVAIAAGAVVAAAPVLLDLDRRVPPRRLLAGGLAYAAGCLAVWAGSRVAASPATFGSYEAGALLAFLLVGAAVLALQAVVPVSLYARWRLVAPLVGLLAATTFVVNVFLHVGGESDPLWLYALLFGPVMVGGIGVLGLLEAGVRRLAGALAS